MSNKFNIFLSFFLWLSFPVASDAMNYYRCVGAKGHITFTDKGCPGGEKSTVTDLHSLSNEQILQAAIIYWRDRVNSAASNSSTSLFSTKINQEAVNVITRLTPQEYMRVKMNFRLLEKVKSADSFHKILISIKSTLKSDYALDLMNK